MSWHGARLAGSDAAINQVTVGYQVQADFGFLCFSYLGHYSFAFFFFYVFKALNREAGHPSQVPTPYPHLE